MPITCKNCGLTAYYLPLQPQGKRFGSLAIWGNRLRQKDQATYMIFAHQDANAYEKDRGISIRSL